MKIVVARGSLSTITPLALAKPPRGGGCTEPYAVAAKDGGFESHLIVTDAPLWSNSIPVDVSAIEGRSSYPASGLVWVDETEADRTLWAEADNQSGWYHNNLNNTPSTTMFWVVDDVAPRTGTYHASFTRPSGDLTADTLDLAFYAQATCEGKFGHAGNPIAYSVRVEEGHEVTLSCWARVTDDSDFPEIGAWLAWEDDDWLAVGSITGSFTEGLTTTYQQVTHTAVAPANAKYAQAYFQVRDIGAVGESAYIDDAILQVVIP